MERIVHIHNQEGFTLCGIQLPPDHNEETCVNDIECVDDPATGCNCIACWRTVVSWNFEQLCAAAQKKVEIPWLEELASELEGMVYRYTYEPPLERAPRREQFPAWYRNALEAQGIVVQSSPPAILGQSVDILPPLEALKFVPRGPDGGEVKAFNVSTVARGLIMIGLTNEQVHAYLQKYFTTT